jgi:hypothetical protein
MVYARLIALALALSLASTSCSDADRGASAVSAFFRHLERHEFEAAADMVRDSASRPMAEPTRREYLAGWRKAYEGYDIHFTKIIVRAIGPAPDKNVQEAEARGGYAYDVKFEGISNSPCVPVSSNVLPLLTQPLAMRTQEARWFLTTRSMVGSVNTCPGG